MRYLLDTNQWSYFQQERTEVVSRFQELSSRASVFMSTVSQAELLVGIELVESQRRRGELLALYDEVIEMANETLPVDSRVAAEFAKIIVELRRKGRPIDTNDIWIAATARAHGLTLVTSDQHFRYVDDLEIEDWTQPREKLDDGEGPPEG